MSSVQAGSPAKRSRYFSGELRGTFGGSLGKFWIALEILPIRVNLFRSRPGKPNQRKADSQAGSRIWGVFVNSEHSSLEKQGEFTKIGAVREFGGVFVEFSLVFSTEGIAAILSQIAV